MADPLSPESPFPTSGLLACLESKRSCRDTALQDPAGSVSFEEVAERAHRLAAELRARGLAGSRLGLSSAPDRDWIEGFWAILLSGGSVVPISPLHPVPERSFLLQRSGARGQLVSAALEPSMPEGPVPRLIFQGGRILGPTATLPPAPAAVPHSPERPAALLLFTSGTTGSPKGVPLSHDNVWSCVDTLITDWGMTRGDRLIHALPLHHVHGICAALLCAFCAGASTELLPRHEPQRVLEAVARGSVLMGVPTQHKRLVEHLDQLPAAEREQHQAALRALRLITSGSAKLPEQLGRRLAELTGQYPLERYGMTEVGIVIGNPLLGARRPGSCGRPLPNSEVRIVDELGRDVGPGEPGEIRIRGGSVFGGYDGDPAATLAAFDAGYFKTGDTAQWTRDGFVEILGRTSVDIIKSGGYKLSAIEIEEQLRAHYWVQDVAVVGVPDDTWGERAVAAVVPSASARRLLRELLPEAQSRPDALAEDARPRAMAEELREWMKQRVAGYQVPKQIVWWPELPRNAMGKVQKPELLRLLSAGR